MKNKTVCKILTVSIALAIIASGIAVSANTTYNLDSEKDDHPQMQPFENHFKPNPTFDHILIIELYYDTYVKGDTDGEFIRMHNPTESTINIGGWQITDDEGIITFPEWANISAGNSLYLAYNATAFHEEMLLKTDFEYGVNSDSTPDMTRTHGRVRLHNDGDEVILKDKESNEIDVVIYGNSDYTGAGWTGLPVKDVEEGVILERDRKETTGQYEDTDSANDWNNHPIYDVFEQSHFPYMTFYFNGTVTVFTSPDSSFKELTNAIDNANESIYLNVYQFHNFYLMDHLIDAINRGVNVKVFLEGDPYRGMGDEERYIAAQIANAGGEVRFMINYKNKRFHDGRYNFNHAKYAIIDNKSTIVMSENWKNTGVPVNSTFGNRGWGIIINNLNVTSYFTDVFFEDWKPESNDSFTFTCNHPLYGNKYGCPPPDFEPNRTIQTGNYSHPFDSKTITGEFNVSPVLAPDTSLMQTQSIIGMINSAEESVYIEQLYIYKDWWSYVDNKNPFLDASINASRRGCDVRILLNPTYTCKQNWDTIDYVRDVAANEGLNLEAKFIDIDSTGLNKTHNKGVIVDSSKVLISSINWNENSARNNREAGVIVENDKVGEYYTDVFLYDWNSSNNQPPIASFTLSPSNPVVNQTITFNTSNSADPDGTIENYEWDFGDGATGSREIVTHPYSSAGNYTVKLIVTDNEGAMNSTAEIINIVPIVTTVLVKNPSEVSEGENFTATVNIDGVSDFAILMFKLTYDPSVIHLTNVEEGSDISTSGWSHWNSVRYSGAGTVKVFAFSDPSGFLPISGFAELARLEFEVVGEAGDKSTIDIQGIIGNLAVESIQAIWVDSEVIVTPTEETKARTFVDLLSKGKFEEAHELFNRDMAEALPEDTLNTTWNSVISNVGEFKGIVKTKTTLDGEYKIVFVTCEFANATLDAKIVFDKEAKIAGLWFVPTESEVAYKPPGYANPDSFTEIECMVGSGEWQLPATLTIPKGEGLFPAVILVHGSGPHDRDETIGSSKPFKDLAWGLATKDIAVLRYEKRTKQYADKIANQMENFTVNEETINDALLAVGLLRKTKEIDSNRIFILGHSLGGMLAPRIAAQDDNLSGLILLAANTRSLPDMILEQSEYLAALDGKIDEEDAKKLKEIREQVIKVKELNISEGEIVLGASKAYWEDLMNYDPVKTARNLTLPILILQGERDYQVTMEDFEGWKNGLGGRDNVSSKAYPCLNHLFIHGTGNSTPAEYAKAGNVAQIVIDDVTEWIKNQAPSP